MADTKLARIGAGGELEGDAVRIPALPDNTLWHVAVTVRSKTILPGPTSIRPAALVKQAPKFAITGAILTPLPALKNLLALQANPHLGNLHFDTTLQNHFISNFNIEHLFKTEKGCPI